MQKYKNLACAVTLIAGAAGAMASAEAPSTNERPRLVAESARDANGVYEESLSRLPLPRREDMTAEELPLYDRSVEQSASPIRMASGPGVGLRGPAGIFLHSPRLSQATTQLNGYLRFEAGLPERLREITVLTVAREADSAYEWAAHEPVARRVGVPDSVIAAIRDRSSLDGLDAGEAAVVRLLREAISSPQVSVRTFDAAVEQFGKRRLVDILALAGNYLGTAMTLKVVAQQMPPEKRSPKPW